MSTKQVFRMALPPALIMTAVFSLAQSDTPAYKPKRINRAIELLADGKPIYYTG